jgi:hypothetical protein
LLAKKTALRALLFGFYEGVRLVPRIDALERHTATEGDDDDGDDEENDDESFF